MLHNDKFHLSKTADGRAIRASREKEEFLLLLQREVVYNLPEVLDDRVVLGVAILVGGT